YAGGRSGYLVSEYPERHFGLRGASDGTGQLRRDREDAWDAARALGIRARQLALLWNGRARLEPQPIRTHAVGRHPDGRHGHPGHDRISAQHTPWLGGRLRRRSASRAALDREGRLAVLR